jgi:hypothetical protein
VNGVAVKRHYVIRGVLWTGLYLLLAHPLILIGMEPLLLEYLKPDAPWHMVAGNVALFAWSQNP